MATKNILVSLKNDQILVFKKLFIFLSLSILIAICDSRENLSNIDNNSNSFIRNNVKNNSHMPQNGNRNSTTDQLDSITLVGDYSTVDSFRKNVEHKLFHHDEVSNSTDENALDQRLKYKILMSSYDEAADGSNFNNSNATKEVINFRSLKHYDDNGEEIISIKREPRAARRSICESGCRCEKDNSFINVVCDFTINNSMDPVFGSKLEVPLKARSFQVKLDRDTRFRLDEGLFQNNTINSVRIEGTYEGQEQVEISRNSFKGNNGPYPEITIIDCNTVVLRSYSFSGEFRLSVKNSKFVKIYEKTFHNTSFEGLFSGIQSLNIADGAFNEAQAKLLIENCIIHELSRFEASLREIKFDNCTIGTIDTGAFDVLRINSIVFVRCKIDVFKTKAITEKLFSLNFSITDAKIGIMESEAISGSGITELILKNNDIDEIQENAIYVTAANATISFNRINKLGDRWLRIKDFTNIHIFQNQFRDFGSMILEDSPNRPVFCKFENNSLTNPRPGSLNIPNQKCIVREISFYRLCTCNTSWLDQLTTRDLRSQSYCRVDETLKFCLKREVYNILAWINEVCNYKASELDCMKSMQQKDVNSKFIQPGDNNDNQQMQLIYILSGVGLLIILILVGFIIAARCYRKRKTSTMPLSESNSGASTTTPNGTAIKSEHKLFSNEDRRIINQTLDILEQKYPPAVFDTVYTNTQILLRGNINEMQRVRSIGDIVAALDECQNSGEDFVAFTDILYRHLASSGGTAPPLEPTYSEPVVVEAGNRETRGPASIPINRSIDGQTNLDHIYAEPTSVQPLLTNEYASPADRSEIADLYSEPISNERDRKIIPPYAIIGPKVYPSTNLSYKRNADNVQQPSTSQNNTHQNLPDVLNPSSALSSSHNNNSNKPLTNVQKMAQSFANDPNFHITRSPNSNRRIPKYTIPNKKQNDNVQHPSTSGKSMDQIDHFSTAISHHHSKPSLTRGVPSSADNDSDHSGGSDITVQMDDIIEYADA